MYVPAPFSNDDASELEHLMDAHDFATLITIDADGRPFATHLPLLVEKEEGGENHHLILRSHMARANPQWKHFACNAEVLAIFHGPHALVHSNWYDSTPNVPTWNYAVVHAYGPARLVENTEDVCGIAYRLVAKHTPDMRPIPKEYETRLLAAVKTFEIRVSRLEGKYKLSQNKDATDREKVRSVLARSQSSTERGVAEMMARLPME